MDIHDMEQNERTMEFGKMKKVQIDSYNKRMRLRARVGVALVAITATVALFMALK